MLSKHLFAKRRGDIHAIFSARIFIRGLVKSITRGSFNSLRFGAIHSEHRTFAIAAKHESCAARVPLGERGADDGFIRGSARDVVKGEFYIKGNTD